MQLLPCSREERCRPLCPAQRLALVKEKELAELKAVRDKLTEAEVRELVKETMTLKERQVLQYSLCLFYTH